MNKKDKEFSQKREKINQKESKKLIANRQSFSQNPNSYTEK